MFQVSAKTDYGLLLMVALAKHADHGPVSLRKIADEQNLPYRFLTQIVIPLRKANLVVSKEGVHGGYELAKSPDKITAGEIVRATEGDVHLVKCMKADFSGCPSASSCTLPRFWNGIASQLQHSLESFTLTELTRTIGSPVEKHEAVAQHS